MLSQNSGLDRAAVVAGVAALLAVLILQLALSIRQQSITWDEDDHIYSGYMSLKTGDFGLNPEHPPLVKMLAALPLLSMDLKVPPLQHREFKHEAFLNGKEFVFGNDADTLLFRARMAASLPTILLAVLVFFAAREMFGLAAAFIALTVLVFDPNLLAHGALVTTDAGLSCFLFAALYTFYRYVKEPSPGRLALVGIATGLAFATKHTGFLAAPSIALLALVEWVRTRKSADPKLRFSFPRAVAALVVTAAISLTVLWAFYGFRYAARPAGLELNPPSAEYIHGLSRPGEAKLLQTIAHYKLLPESYLYGLADVRMISDFYASYLLGKPYPHGVWFYFPVAMLIKSTVPFLVLLGMSVWAIVRRKLPVREVWFLALPPALYLAVAMSAHMNIGMRHVLPMYAFLTVLEAAAAMALARESRRWTYVLVMVLAFQVVTSVKAYPEYIPYANELWGGSSQTYKLLSDSNADWGQQLKATSRYLQQRGVKDCWFSYFAEGVVPYQYYGIPCKPLPTPDAQWIGEKFDVPVEIDGPVLISGSNLSGYEYGPAELNPYAQFQELKPTAVIQNGVYVFEGHFALPMAAAIGHVQKANEFQAAKRLDEALAEAQTAVTLAPTSVKANVTLGDVLRAMGREDEARRSYEKALKLAQTIAPEFQVGWVETVRGKLEGK